MENKALFLDFDGVLFDTLREVYLVNRYEFLNVDLFSEVDEKNYQLFSKYKYLVYNIWMFYYYNPIIFNNTNEDEIAEKYNKAILNRDLEKEKIFCENFLNTRKKLVLNHYEFWKNLETPYNFFFEIKKIYEENNINVVIVSKKNKTSILERFESQGLNFNPDLVFAREALDKYSSKGEFLDEYMTKNNIDSAIFVDDNNNNLKSCENNFKIKNILALWGNTQPNIQGYSEVDAIFEIKKFFNIK